VRSARVALPAAGWLAQGGDQHPHGFVYRDRSQDAPVDQVSISADHLTVRASGPGWTYTLDEAQQGRVALRLDMGAARGARAPTDTRQRPQRAVRRSGDSSGKRGAGPGHMPEPLTVGETAYGSASTSGSTVRVRRRAAAEPAGDRLDG
jgi:hypothetical protein